MESRFELVDDDPLKLSTATLGKDLLQALVAELQSAKDCWQKLSQLEQQYSIERLRARVGIFVREAMTTMLGAHYPCCPAELVGIAVKDEIRATLRMSKNSSTLHQMGDAVGTNVVVVVANAEDWLARMGEIRAKADQGDLFPLSDAPAEQSAGEAPAGSVIVDLSTGEIMGAAPCEEKTLEPAESPSASGSPSEPSL